VTCETTFGSSTDCQTKQKNMQIALTQMVLKNVTNQSADAALSGCSSRLRRRTFLFTTPSFGEEEKIMNDTIFQPAARGLLFTDGSCVSI